MKLKLALLATGALAISFLSAGAANGLWSSPALRQHAIDGLKTAIGLSYGQKGSGKLVTYAMHAGSLSADGTAVAPSLVAETGLAGAPSLPTARTAQQAEALAAPHLAAPRVTEKQRPSRHPANVQMANAHLPVLQWARVEPEAPPMPPEPPAAPQPKQVAAAISSLEPHSSVTLSFDISQASKAAMISLRAQATAQPDPQAAGADRQAAQSDRAAADEVRAQAQAEVHMAQELLTVAERISASITKGDYSQISVNYNGPNRCGRPDLLPGCAPLTDEDKARIRAEARKNLEAARADLRRAVVAFQRQTRANLPDELNKARAG